MERKVPSFAASLEGLHRAPFAAAADIARRTQAHVIAALGFNPKECPYRVAGSGTHWAVVLPYVS